VSVATRNNHSHLENLWEKTAPPGPSLHSLDKKVSSDVAIIGAGIAGLSTAIHLAQEGVIVIVLESGQPGSGATGQSGGLIVPDFIRHLPSDLERALGAEAGTKLINMIGNSAEACFALIDKYKIDCDARQNGFWVPAHDKLVAAALQQRAHEWAARGFKVRYAGISETIETLGANKYCGAMVYKNGGTLNPLAYCRGLASVALELGVRIFNNSEALELERTRSHWLIKTPEGEVEASDLVLAANGGNAKLHHSLKNTVLPLDVIEYATAPLTLEQRRTLLKDRVAFTDKQNYLFTARCDSADRLVSAFPDFATSRSQKTLLKEAKRRIKQHFPQLGPVEIEFLWPGQAWINTDLLPKVYALGENAVAIQACNGRGIASNTIIGSELAKAIITRDFSNLPVEVTAPRPVKPYGLLKHLPAVLMTIARAKNQIQRLFNR